MEFENKIMSLIKDNGIFLGIVLYKRTEYTYINTFSISQKIQYLRIFIVFYYNCQSTYNIYTYKWIFFYARMTITWPSDKRFTFKIYNAFAIVSDDCEAKEGTPCQNGACLDSLCHCNDGYGGCSCQVPGTVIVRARLRAFIKARSTRGHSLDTDVT